MYGHHSSTRRAGGRRDASEGAYTRVNHPSRVCTCTRVHGRSPKIYVAYLRVRKARTFTGVREIIYSGIDFLASDALSCHSALTIHLQRPARLARRVAQLLFRETRRTARGSQMRSRRMDDETTRRRAFSRPSKYDSTELLDEPDGFISFSLDS